MDEGENLITGSAGVAARRNASEKFVPGGFQYVQGFRWVSYPGFARKAWDCFGDVAKVLFVRCFLFAISIDR